MDTRKKKSTRAATLADVGRAAGVSAMAVSAALSETRTSARISEKTRAKIVKAAEKLGYRPNVAARALASRRMNTIGVAVVWEGEELNLYFVEILSGIIEASARFGQTVTVFTFRDWKADMERVRAVCDGRIDGMILTAPLVTEDFADRLPRHTPFVALHANAEVAGVVNIESDEEQGARDMVANLIAMGHRRILHISGGSELLGAKRRINGYRRALDEAGIAFDPDLLVAANFTMADGRAAMLRWIESHKNGPLPDAIFCASDAIATGCLEALASSGLRVPDDVSVCGFDDTIAARTTVPQLSTVRQPLRQMAARAVEVLMARIDSLHGKSQDWVASPIVFGTTVVMRTSTGEAGKRKKRGKKARRERL
jgi:LacI family transcriptional regulator